MAEDQEEDLELSDFEDEDLDAAPEVVSSNLVDTPREGSNNSAVETPTKLTPTLHSPKPAISVPTNENVDQNENGDRASLPDGEFSSAFARERRQREEAEAALREESARAEAVEKLLKSSQSRQVSCALCRPSVIGDPSFE